MGCLVVMLLGVCAAMQVVTLTLWLQGAAGGWLVPAPTLIAAAVLLVLHVLRRIATKRANRLAFERAVNSVRGWR